MALCISRKLSIFPLNHSLLIGVYRRKNRWVMQLNGKYGGSFQSEIDAAKAYDKAALKLFGEFASLNF
jgi:hypothetical protein